MRRVGAEAQAAEDAEADAYPSLRIPKCNPPRPAAGNRLTLWKTPTYHL